MSPISVRAAVAALVLTGATATPARSAAAQGAAPPLVSTEWLARRLAAPDARGLVLLHVGDAASYAARHIPGARHVGFADVATRDRTPTSLALEMLPPDSLRRNLERLGISDASHVVVVFGDDWVSPATRVLFTLDWIGVRASLLDGGLAQWVRDGHAVTDERPAAATPGRLSARTPKATVVDAAWLQRHARTAGHRLLDARAPVFYEGPAHEGMPAGHVPGAVNLPFTSVAGDDLRILPTDSLRALFRAAGVQRGDTVVAYCHIGQQATAVLFAARLLGHDVRLYDGSFQDWARRELPREGGADARRER